MPTDTHLLTLSQWFSPAYPVGAYSYSHGLEWAIEAGDVTGAASAQDWIADVLAFGAGRNDALFLGAAYDCDVAELAALDATCLAFAASAERVKETRLQGEAFAKVTGDMLGQPITARCYPVAVGWAARLAGLPIRLTTQMYLQAFMANLAAVAMRLVPLGQTDGQRIIRDLTPLCQQIAEDVEGQSLDDLASTTFLPDIASMKHETQYSRIFRT